MYTYTLLGFKLIVTTNEKDLGIIIDSSMKISTECAAVLMEPNEVLRCIRKIIENYNPHYIN